MTGSSFMSVTELASIGFKHIGKNVKISRFARLYNPNNMIIGDNVRIDDFCILSAPEKTYRNDPGFFIADYTHIAGGCMIFGGGGFYADVGCTLSGGVKIYTGSDDYGGDYLIGPCFPSHVRNVITHPLYLEKYVAVGAGSIILPTTHQIGEGVAIGANSLIRSPCKRWTIYVGSPAKEIRERSKGLLKLAAELQTPKMDYMD
jgi:galactoside O-acetyltransferase